MLALGVLKTSKHTLPYTDLDAGCHGSITTLWSQTAVLLAIYAT